MEIVLKSGCVNTEAASLQEIFPESCQNRPPGLQGCTVAGKMPGL
jgi:hypothetical protein